MPLPKRLTLLPSDYRQKNLKDTVVRLREAPVDWYNDQNVDKEPAAQIFRY